jgi:hypothetical protein
MNALQLVTAGNQLSSETTAASRLDGHFAGLSTSAVFCGQARCGGRLLEKLMS